jgi:hypothetical protein
MQLAATQVRKFSQEFDLAMGVTITAAAGAFAAVGTITTAIIALGNKGSVLNDIEESFDRLAKAAGSSGKELFDAFNEGVQATVDSAKIMKSTTVLLSSGMKLTTDQAKLLAQSARELGKATGTDAASGLQTLSQALATGNTRAIRRLGITIDMVQKEKEFAASIGRTRAELSQAGITEARRVAIFEALEKRMQSTGVSALTFKERMQQATVAVGNWFDDLAKGVAKSTAVNKAFDDVRKALVDAFGDSTQTLLKTILGWVDDFATGVSRVAPVVIKIFGDIKDGIVGIWNWLVDFNERWQITSTLVSIAKTAWGLLEKAFTFVRFAVEAVIKAWSSMPEWLQKLTKGALEATLAATAYGVAIYGVTIPARALIDAVDQTINILGNFLSGLAGGVVIYDKITSATVLFTRAQNFLTASTLAAQINITALIAKFVGLDAATKFVTASTALFGTALNVALGVVLPLVTAIGLLYMSLGELKTAFSELGQHSFWETISATNTDNWVRRLIGWGDEAQRMKNRTVDAFDMVADARKRMDADLSGATLANEVEELRLAWHRMSPTMQKSAEAIKNVGEQALALRERGGRLHPELKRLADIAEAARPKIGGLGASFIKAKDDTTRFAATLSGSALTKQIKELAEEVDHVRKTKGDFGFNIPKLIETAKTIESLRLQGGKLPPVLQQIRDQFFFIPDLVAETRASMSLLSSPLAQVTNQLKTGTLAWFQWVTAVYGAIEAKKRFFNTMQAPDFLLQMPKFQQPLEKTLSLVDWDALEANSTLTLQQIANRHKATYEEMTKHPERYSSATIAAFKRIAKEAQDTADGVTTNWRAVGDSMVSMFVAIADIAGDSMSAVARAIGTAAAAGKGMRDSFDVMKASLAGGKKDWKSFGNAAVGAAGAAVQAWGSIQAATDTLDRKKNIAGGAMSGAAAGMQMAGPWGALVGAGVGALIGAFRNRDAMRAYDEVAHDIGVQISDELAKTIQDEGNKRGGGQMNRWATEVLMLGEIIEDVGGVTEKNFEGMAKQFYQAQIFLHEGTISVEEFETMAGKAFPAIASYALEMGGLWKGTFRDMIDEMEDTGTATKDLAELMKRELSKLGPATAAVAKGLSFKLGTAFSGLAPGISETDVTSISDKLTSGERLSRDEQARLDRIKKTNSQIVANYQESFDRVSRITFMSFAAELAHGTSTVEAIRHHKDAIGELIAASDRYGFANNAAYESLARWNNLVDFNAPLLDQMGALVDITTVLENTGGLTADTFHDLQVEAASTVDALEANGFTAAEALSTAIPFLEMAIELHEERGYAIDAETQAMIDQAREQGLLADKQLTTNDILMQGLKALIEAVGGVLPEAWKTAAAGARTAAENIERSFNGIEIDPVRVDVEYNYGTPSGPNEGGGPQYESDGGVIYAARGRRVPFVPRGSDTVPAMLTPGERVLSVDQNREYEQRLREGDRPIKLTVPVFLGNDVISEYIIETTLKKLENNDGGGAPVGPTDRMAKALAGRLSQYLAS